MVIFLCQQIKYILLRCCISTFFQSIVQKYKNDIRECTSYVYTNWDLGLIYTYRFKWIIKRHQRKYYALLQGRKYSLHTSSRFGRTLSLRKVPSSFPHSLLRELKEMQQRLGRKQPNELKCITFHTMLSVVLFPLTLARQRYLSSWGPRRTPMDFL